jgi:hypothetical protein
VHCSSVCDVVSATHGEREGIPPTTLTPGRPVFFAVSGRFRLAYRLLSYMASVAQSGRHAAPAFSWSNRLTITGLPTGCRECLRTSLPCHVRRVRIRSVCCWRSLHPLELSIDVVHVSPTPWHLRCFFRRNTSPPAFRWSTSLVFFARPAIRRREGRMTSLHRHVLDICWF